MPAVTREIRLNYGSVAVASVAAAGGGNTAYTMEDTNADSTVPSWIQVGIEVEFYGCTNAVNNGSFTVQSVSGLVITVNNAAGVVEAASPGSMALLIAGVSNFHMHDKHRKGNDYKTKSYNFDVVITETSESTFFARCLALERAFRLPRQRFRYIFNGTVRDDLNPVRESGGNTGFNQTAEIEKVGDDFDTGRSRRYRVKVEAQLPADLAGVSGRQDSSVEVSLDGARRRTITISGKYTALGNNNARAQYDASIATYAAAVHTAIAGGDGSVYELVTEMAMADDQDKNLDFRRVYEEVIYNQSSGGRDHAAIVQGRYRYTRQQMAPGDSDSSARRLEPYIVDFECWVDKNQSQDLAGLWTGTIKPYLLSQGKSIWTAGSAAVMDIKADADPSTNRVFGQIVMHVVAEGGGNLIQATYTTRIQKNSGKILVPVWDGNVLAKHVYDGPADIIRTRTTTKLMLGSTGGGGAGPTGASFGGGVTIGSGRQFINFASGHMQPIMGGSNTGAAQTALVQAVLSDGAGQEEDVGAPVGATGWVNLSDTITTTPITIGLPDGQLDLVEITREVVDAWVEAPQGGGGDVAT